jgi:hypothetical protein
MATIMCMGTVTTITTATDTTTTTRPIRTPTTLSGPRACGVT